MCVCLLYLLRSANILYSLCELNQLNVKNRVNANIIIVMVAYHCKHIGLQVTHFSCFGTSLLLVVYFSLLSPYPVVCIFLSGVNRVSFFSMLLKSNCNSNFYCKNHRAKSNAAAQLLPQRTGCYFLFSVFPLKISSLE